MRNNPLVPKKEAHATKTWFSASGELLQDIPPEAIEECTVPGQDASEALKYWIQELQFHVPEDLARHYLQPFGAWEDLTTAPQQTLAQRVLWVACGDLRENKEWFGLVS